MNKLSFVEDLKSTSCVSLSQEANKTTWEMNYNKLWPHLYYTTLFSSAPLHWGHSIKLAAFTSNRPSSSSMSQFDAVMSYATWCAVAIDDTKIRTTTSAWTVWPPFIINWMTSYKIKFLVRFPTLFDHGRRRRRNYNGNLFFCRSSKWHRKPPPNSSL